MTRGAFPLLALLGLGVVACSSDEDGGSGKTLSACVERPDTLPRPPAGTLPCELIAPGLSLGK
jgi:hypothetical protein